MKDEDHADIIHYMVLLKMAINGYKRGVMEDYLKRHNLAMVQERHDLSTLEDPEQRILFVIRKNPKEDGQ